MVRTELNLFREGLFIIRKNIYAILVVLVPLFITGFLYYVNEIIISIRLDELRVYLQDTDSREGGVDHIALIATYEVHKKIYERKMNQDTADAVEARLKLLSLPKDIRMEESRGIKAVLSFPAVSLLNFNRWILGKHPVNPVMENDRDYREIDEAYYCERNFLLKQAVIHYEKALENSRLTPRLRSSILLRQGYCYAMTGDNHNAFKNYNKVISEYSQESSAITASILSRYLEGFTLARERVMSAKYDPLMKSQMLVNLLAYEQALGIIRSIESKTGFRDIPRILYYKARCHSGLGQPDKAVETYLRVIKSAPDSPYAKYSNRKLFMIGASIGGSNRISVIAEMNNEKLKDPVLAQIIMEQKNKPLTGTGSKTKTAREFRAKIDERAEHFVMDKTTDKHSVLVIKTSDGNTFKGKLIEENRNVISIQTSIGRIDVKRDKITSVTKQ